MNCRFLENMTLSSLFAPITDEQFRKVYWERSPLIVHRQNPDYYGDLFTLHDFDEGLTRAPNYVKIANATINKHGQYKSDTARGLDGVLSDMRNGGTLVLDQWHRREPKLGLLCRMMQRQLGHPCQTNLYLTPPQGHGFPPHWDNHDVFILQVLGSKHWKIEKNRRRAFPHRTEVMEKEGRALEGELDSFTLKQGDAIYIPRGFVHAAECGEEPSLHITLGVTPYHWDDLLATVIKAASLRDERLRHALPIGFMNGSREHLVKGAIAALRSVIDESFLNGVVDQYRDELVAKFPVDVSGQIEDFFSPQPLGLDDVVGPRPGMIYTLHQQEDTVQLNFAARTITFAGSFKEPLDFALNTASYAIRDIPGPLDLEDKVLFTGRLIEEGLVVRHRNGET